MVNPINETVNVSANAGAVNKKLNKTAPITGGDVKPDTAGQAILMPDAFAGSSGIKKSGSEGADHPIMKDQKDEVKKNEIRDGELTINVYDGSGKLLRKIPPGYLPAGEKLFDVMV